MMVELIKAIIIFKIYKHIMIAECPCFFGLIYIEAIVRGHA